MTEEKPSYKPEGKPEEAKPAPEPAEKPAAKPTAEKPAAPAVKPAAPAAHGAAAAPAEPPKPLEPGQFGQFLKEHGIQSTRLADSSRGVETILLDGDKLDAAMRLLRHSPEIALNYLVTVSGVDNTDSFDSVYVLWSYSNNNELIVKVRIKKSDVKEDGLPMVPSISPFWKAADWHERETFDLVGIRYLGHPYLRRILNPWDWEGYPLRKDYKQLVDALNDRNPHSMR